MTHDVSLIIFHTNHIWGPCGYGSSAHRLWLKHIIFLLAVSVRGNAHTCRWFLSISPLSDLMDFNWKKKLLESESGRGIRSHIKDAQNGTFLYDRISVKIKSYPWLLPLSLRRVGYILRSYIRQAVWLSAEPVEYSASYKRPSENLKSQATSNMGLLHTLTICICLLATIGSVAKGKDVKRRHHENNALRDGGSVQSGKWRVPMSWQLF